MILADIIHAIKTECHYLFIDNGGMVVLDTNIDNDLSFSYPLCIIEVSAAPESAILSGNGAIRLDWDFAINVYNGEYEAYDDDNKYSSNLMNVFDTVRNHFIGESWKTNEMVNLRKNYGFRCTFTGINTATPAEDGKQNLGYKLSFSTIAIDQSIATSTNTVQSTMTVTKV